MKQSLNRSIALLEPAASAFAPKDKTALLIAFRRYHEAGAKIAYLETPKASREKGSVGALMEKHAATQARDSAKEEIAGVLGSLKEDQFKSLLDGTWKEAKKTGRNFLRAFAPLWSGSAAAFSLSFTLLVFAKALPAEWFTPLAVAAIFSGAVMVSIMVALPFINYVAEGQAASLEVELKAARNEAGSRQGAIAAAEIQTNE